MTRHFVRDDDISQAEQARILDLAVRMKQDRFGYQALSGPKAVAMIFDKPSTRTRVSFSVGITELGGAPVVLDAQTTQLGRGESVEDTARALDRQVAAIVWRTFEQENLDAMAAISSVPVINALSDLFHPCQLLADLLTIREHKGALAGLTVAYFGDVANNMAHSYALAGALAGMHLRLAGPEQVKPDPAVMARANEIARATGGSVERFTDAKPAAYGADVVATDTWASMGSGPLTPDMKRAFEAFRINQSLLQVAAPDAIVLHCLPAYRGKEISAEVLDGPQSVVWDQAENRLHVQKALLTLLLQWS